MMFEKYKKTWAFFGGVLLLYSIYLIRERMDHDLLNGQSYQAWKEKYDQESEINQKMAQRVLDHNFNFSGIELLVIGPGDKYFSLFGHVILRFVGSSNDPYQDLTVSFMIDAHDFEFGNWKGYFGGRYKIFPLIQTMQENINHQVNEQKRTITRYAIPMKPESRELLIINLRSLIQEPSKLGTYAMLDNSCTNALNFYLKKSQFPTEDIEKKMIFPNDLLLLWNEKGLIPHPPFKFEKELSSFSPELYLSTLAR